MPQARTSFELLQQRGGWRGRLDYSGDVAQRVAARTDKYQSYVCERSTGCVAMASRDNIDTGLNPVLIRLIATGATVHSKLLQSYHNTFSACQSASRLYPSARRCDSRHICAGTRPLEPPPAPDSAARLAVSIFAALLHGVRRGCSCCLPNAQRGASSTSALRCDLPPLRRRGSRKAVGSVSRDATEAGSSAGSPDSRSVESQLLMSMPPSAATDISGGSLVVNRYDEVPGSRLKMAAASSSPVSKAACGRHKQLYDSQRISVGIGRLRQHIRIAHERAGNWLRQLRLPASEASKATG